jgi:hypothetical protein
MLGNRSRPRIPLPKQWSKRVRSGVLHAICLADGGVAATEANSVPDITPAVTATGDGGLWLPGAPMTAACTSHERSPWSPARRLFDE